MLFRNILLQCTQLKVYLKNESGEKGIRLFPREVLSDFLRRTLLFLALPDCPVFLLVDNGSYRKRKSPFFLLNLLFVQTKSPINFVVLFRFFCAIFKHILHCQIHNVMNERLRGFLCLMLFCTKGVLITV